MCWIFARSTSFGPQLRLPSSLLEDYFIDPYMIAQDARCVAVPYRVNNPKRARTSMEARPVKSAPKRSPVNAVLLCLKNRAPLPPKGTPSQQKATWLGPPSDPPPEFAEAESQSWHISAGVNPPWQWCARERVLIQSIENYVLEPRDPLAQIRDEVTTANQPTLPAFAQKKTKRGRLILLTNQRRRSDDPRCVRDSQEDTPGRVNGTKSRWCRIVDSGQGARPTVRIQLVHQFRIPCQRGR